jgi:TRAP-type mannitol/chloroaromatic compound transport system permease small subunit
VNQGVPGWLAHAETFSPARVRASALAMGHTNPFPLIKNSAEGFFRLWPIVFLKYCLTLISRNQIMVYAYFFHSVIIDQFALMAVQKTAQAHVSFCCANGGIFSESKEGQSSVSI